MAKSPAKKQPTKTSAKKPAKKAPQPTLMERLRALPEAEACALLADEDGPMSRQYLWQIRAGRRRMSLRMFARVVARMAVPAEVAKAHLLATFPEEAAPP